MDANIAKSEMEGKAVALVKWIVDAGIKGGAGFKGAEALAAEYLGNGRYRNHHERVEALTRTQTAWNFGTGFASGLGGLLTLPVAIPASLGSAWLIQARLAAAIAIIYGYDPDSEEVRTAVLLCLLGGGAREALKRAGVAIGTKVAQNTVAKIPGKVLIEINKQVGFRLLTKMGTKGAINLVKIVPIIGGVVGGTVDGASCFAVGRAAREMFGVTDSSDEEVLVEFEGEDEASGEEREPIDPRLLKALIEVELASGRVAPFCSQCGIEAMGVYCSECGAQLGKKVRVRRPSPGQKPL